MKPLWFVKYDPERTDVKTMRHSSPMFNKLSEAMDYARNGSITHGYSFAEYAVIRYGSNDNKIVTQGTTDFEI